MTHIASVGWVIIGSDKGFLANTTLHKADLWTAGPFETYFGEL